MLSSDNRSGEPYAEEIPVDLEPGVRVTATVAYGERTAVDRLLVLFPPHPSLGGDTRNNVLQALLREGTRREWLTLLLDYRGTASGRVGSEPQMAYWDRLDAAQDYTPIVHDCERVIGHVCRSFGTRPELRLAGYSFGALLALQVAVPLRATAVAGISPPLTAHDFAPWLAPAPRTRLYAASDDPFCPLPLFQETGRRYPAVSTEVLAGDDHFFRGSETHVAAAVLAPLLEAP